MLRFRPPPWSLLLGHLDLRVTRPRRRLRHSPLPGRCWQLPDRSFRPLTSFADSRQAARETRAEDDVPEGCPVHGAVVFGRGRGIKDASRSDRVVSLTFIPRELSRSPLMRAGKSLSGVTPVLPTERARSSAGSHRLPCREHGPGRWRGGWPRDSPWPRQRLQLLFFKRIVILTT